MEPIVFETRMLSQEPHSYYAKFAQQKMKRIEKRISTCGKLHRGSL